MRSEDNSSIMQREERRKEKERHHTTSDAPLSGESVLLLPPVGLIRHPA